MNHQWDPTMGTSMTINEANGASQKWSGWLVAGRDNRAAIDCCSIRLQTLLCANGQTLRAEAGYGMRTSLYYDVARIYSYTKVHAFHSLGHRFDTYRNVYIRASSTVIQRGKATMRSKVIVRRECEGLCHRSTVSTLLNDSKYSAR